MLNAFLLNGAKRPQWVLRATALATALALGPGGVTAKVIAAGRGLGQAEVSGEVVAYRVTWGAASGQAQLLVAAPARLVQQGVAQQQATALGIAAQHLEKAGSAQGYATASSSATRAPSDGGVVSGNGTATGSSLATRIPFGAVPSVGTASSSNVSGSVTRFAQVLPALSGSEYLATAEIAVGRSRRSTAETTLVLAADNPWNDGGYWNDTWNWNDGVVKRHEGFVDTDATATVTLTDSTALVTVTWGPQGVGASSATVVATRVHPGASSGVATGSSTVVAVITRWSSAQGVPPQPYWIINPASTYTCYPPPGPAERRRIHVTPSFATTSSAARPLVLWLGEASALATGLGVPIASTPRWAGRAVAEGVALPVQAQPSNQHYAQVYTDATSPSQVVSALQTQAAQAVGSLAVATTLSAWWAYMHQATAASLTTTGASVVPWVNMPAQATGQARSDILASVVPWVNLPAQATGQARSDILASVVPWVNLPAQATGQARSDSLAIAGPYTNDASAPDSRYLRILAQPSLVQVSATRLIMIPAENRSMRVTR